MILASSFFEIREHDVPCGKEKKSDYLVYSLIINHRHDFTCDEDVLMIYSNIAHKKIYLDERFYKGVDLNKFVRDPMVRNNIMVLGYDNSEFEHKYFTVLL